MPERVLEQSVEGSGNSTFLQNSELKLQKKGKIQLFVTSHRGRERLKIDSTTATHQSLV